MVAEQMSEMRWFDGETYDPSLDGDRLKRQLSRVWGIMFLNQRQWLTLQEIRRECGDPVQSISARLRDFRKAKFGGHDIQRRKRYAPGRGVFEYRLRLEK